MVAQVISQVVSFALMTVVGFYASKKGFVDKNVRAGLSMIITNIAMPSSILAASAMTYDSEKVSGIFQMLAFSLFYFAFTIGFAMLAAKLLPIKSERKNLFTVSVVFSNAGFMGFPMLSIFYGDIGIFYGSIFNVVFNIMLFTYGAGIFVKQSKSSEDSTNIKSILLQPAVLAAFLMIVLFALQIKLPKVILSTCNILGSMTTPLSMIVIGAMLGTVKLKEVFTEKFAYLTAAFRLVLVPLIIAPILYFLNVSATIATVCIVIAAMPTAATVGIFGERYNVLPELATKTIVISVVAFVVTMPLITWVIYQLFPA